MSRGFLRGVLVCKLGLRVRTRPRSGDSHVDASMHRVGLLRSGVSGRFLRYSKVDFHLTGFDVASGIMRKISRNRRQISLDISVIVHVSSCQCSRWEGLLSMMHLSRLSSLIFLHMVFRSDSSRKQSISNVDTRGNSIGDLA